MSATQTAASATGDATSSRTATVAVTSIALATFGPYLFGSIRTEQAVVYGLAVLLLLPSLTRFRAYGGARFMLPWVGYILVASLGVIAPSAAPAPYESGNLLGGYDNILLPLALMLLLWSIVPDEKAEMLLQRFLKIIAIGMAANGALALIATRIDTSALLRPFWSAGDGNTVADNAALMGRYSGIFNQPAEAGALYGIGGLAAIYAWSNRGLLCAVLLTFITLGGLISVSKVFILGALPAIAVYWLWANRGGRKVALLFGLVIIVLGVVESGLLSQWTGSGYLGRLFVGGQGDLVGLYSAGRFTDDSAFLGTIESALAYSPVSGVGAAGWRTSYDGALAEAMVVGGVLGTLLVAIVTLSLFTLRGHLQRGHQRMFAFLFAATSFAASLGFAPLTANRVSTVSWVIIALLVGITRHNRKASALGLK